MIGTTHLFFAFALAYLAGFPVVYGMVGGLLPDADLLLDAGYPLTHRGLVHTPLAAVVAAAILFLVTGRRGPAAGLATGYLSHLFLDTFTYSGIRWLYPVQDTPVSFAFVGYADVTANLGVMVLSVALSVGWRYRREVERWTT